MNWVKPPSRAIPKMTCSTPARATERKNNSTLPSSIMAAAQMVVSPAAGPLTLRGDPLTRVTIRPPIIPASKPEYMGVPEASAIPRHRGSATKKTVILALKSCFRKVRAYNCALLLLVLTFSLQSDTQPLNTFTAFVRTTPGSVPDTPCPGFRDDPGEPDQSMRAPAVSDSCRINWRSRVR